MSHTVYNVTADRSHQPDGLFGEDTEYLLDPTQVGSNLNIFAIQNDNHTTE